MLYKDALSASPEASRGLDPCTFFSNPSSSNSLMRVSVSSWASVTGQAAHRRGQPTGSHLFSLLCYRSSNKCITSVSIGVISLFMWQSTSLWHTGHPSLHGGHGQLRISLLMPLSQASILRSPRWLTICWFEHLGISWVNLKVYTESRERLKKEAALFRQV